MESVIDGVRPALKLLLRDKTKKANIIWATATYASLGLGYGRDDEMLPSLFGGFRAGIIRPRTRRSREEQTERTRRRAEVFTPVWICDKMLSYCDDEWFGSEGAFGGEKVLFPKGRSWKAYIDSRRLEIACGEAPFLVSRYDAATGEAIPIARRVGALDRKLRVVGENAQGEAEWLRWAFRALQSVYGYEYQGDSLLIARANLVSTFSENLTARWGRAPSESELLKAANIAAWNLWQMDGLTLRAPGVAAQSAGDMQLSLFEPEETSEQIGCRVFDWRADRSVAFGDINRDNIGRKVSMKFDYVIGNPPYQQESDSHSQTNGQKPMTNIFQYFQESADAISTYCTAMIYPGGRWIHRSGKGLQEFGLKQINAPELSCVVYYPDASDIFGNAASLPDGITIVIKNKTKKKLGFKYIYSIKNAQTTLLVDNPGEKLIPLNPINAPIIKKIDRTVSNRRWKFLHESILTRSLFGIESDFAEKNPSKVKRYDGEVLNYDKGEIKLLTNDRAGKAGRAIWFVTHKSDIPNGQEFINQWQVVVSSANAGGQKRDNQIEVIDNHSAFGRSRLALRSFKSQEEANNFFIYANSYLIKYAFMMTDESLTSLGKEVPDIGNYKTDNGIINFSREIDSQLFTIFDFTQEEVLHIKDIVDNVRKKEMA